MILRHYNCIGKFLLRREVVIRRCDMMIGLPRLEVLNELYNSYKA